MKIRAFLKSKLCREIVITLGAMAILFSALGIYFYYTLPFAEMQKLSKIYVRPNPSKDSVSYQFVKKRPSTWTTLSEMNFKAIEAIVVSEDWDFYGHHGIDPNQIKEAIEDNVVKGRPMRGASTITQQLVKNLYLSNEKTLTRKIQEIFLAIYLEKYVSKKRILETYLNVIEYGYGIYGIQAASNYYFNKRPSELTPREGAFLAMLLPNPKKYSVSFRKKKLTYYASKSIERILAKLVAAGYLTEEEFLESANTRFSWEETSSDAEVEATEENAEEETVSF